MVGAMNTLRFAFQSPKLSTSFYVGLTRKEIRWKFWINSYSTHHLLTNSKLIHPENVNANRISTLEAARTATRGTELLTFYADHHVVPLPEGHRFPMDKYRATRLALEADSSLEGKIILFPSPLASREELALVHDENYIDKFMTGNLTDREQRTLGFPWSQQLAGRSSASTGGTIAAMHSVLLGLRKFSSQIAGGTHHAFSSHGEGFCVFNDIAVASAIALKEYPEKCNEKTPILVLDLDVHQGNGTAKIFENEDRVITFSMHGEKNYPWKTKMRSNYDIELEDNTEDEKYLKILQEWLPRLYANHTPSLVFFQAGVDALKEDSFGRLSMTRQGMARRNNMVYSFCLEKNIPLVTVMGGGYSRPPDASILAHTDVFRTAAYRVSASGP